MRQRKDEEREMPEVEPVSEEPTDGEEGHYVLNHYLW